MPRKKAVTAAAWVCKKPDSAMLSRKDIQFDLLRSLFSNDAILFTLPDSDPSTEPIKVTFAVLYFHAIYNSTKSTSNLKKKLDDSLTFRDSFCMLSLLINIGKINTTVAFYASMKTALRTYHPVPSLQVDEITRTQMQDAPRLKVILKGSLLPGEKDPPITLNQLSSGPPTTVITLLFLIFAEHEIISSTYLLPGIPIKDLFHESHLSPATRANAFLTVLHRILETKSLASDLISPPPPLFTLDPSPIVGPSNVDTLEEFQYAEEMKIVRAAVGNDAGSTSQATTGTVSPVKRKSDIQPPPPPSKRAATESTPTESSLVTAWSILKRDLQYAVNPAYESDEDSSHDFLLRRSMITFLDPTTNVRGKPSEAKGFWDELQKRRILEELKAVVVEERYPGYDLESGNGGGGSEAEY